MSQVTWHPLTLKRLSPPNTITPKEINKFFWVSQICPICPQKRKSLKEHQSVSINYRSIHVRGESAGSDRGLMCMLYWPKHTVGWRTQWATFIRMNGAPSQNTASSSLKVSLVYTHTHTTYETTHTNATTCWTFNLHLYNTYIRSTCTCTPRLRAPFLLQNTDTQSAHSRPPLV